MMAAWAGMVTAEMEAGGADGLDEEEGRGLSRERPVPWAHVGRVAGLGPGAHGRSSPLCLSGEGREAFELATIPASLQVVQVPGASRRRAAVGKAPRAGTSASEKV